MVRKRLRLGGLVLSRDTKIVRLEPRVGYSHERPGFDDSHMFVCSIVPSRDVTPKDGFRGWLAAVTSAVEAYPMGRLTREYVECETSTKGSTAMGDTVNR